MNVADVMTQPVISVTPETPIAETARLMLQHRISGLPVVDPSGAVVGMVTEGDLLRRVETGTERRHAHWLEFLIAPGRLAREYAVAHALKAGEIMTEDVAAVAPQDSLTEVVRLMEDRHVKRLPVIEAGRLVGIVSRANLVRALVHNLAKPAGEPTGKGVATDSEIREQILAEILQAALGAAGQCRCQGRGRGGRALWHHHRRSRTHRAPGPRRKHPRRQSGARPPRLGRADIRLCDPGRKVGAAGRRLSRWP